jgi:antitoxin YefM
MPSETTYQHARTHLADLCEQAISAREPILIRRPGAADVALIAADELRGLMETAHLLSSPENARRLLTALERARGGQPPVESPEALRREFDLGPTP